MPSVREGLFERLPHKSYDTLRFQAANGTLNLMCFHERILIPMRGQAIGRQIRQTKLGRVRPPTRWVMPLDLAIAAFLVNGLGYHVRD